MPPKLHALIRFLSHRYAFGTTGRGRTAMCFVEGDKLLYPVGVHVAMHSCSTDEVGFACAGCAMVSA